MFLTYIRPLNTLAADMKQPYHIKLEGGELSGVSEDTFSAFQAAWTSNR